VNSSVAPWRLIVIPVGGTMGPVSTQVWFGGKFMSSLL
jgi:hypothetical protein